MNYNEEIKRYLEFILDIANIKYNEYCYMWVSNKNNTYNRQYYFNSYEEALTIINSNKYNNIYIGLATTDGLGYKTENLINRSVVVVDIDEQGLTVQDIYKRCTRVGLFAHLVVKSGRGWHLYFKLDKNYKIQDIVKANKHVTELFEADSNACSPTQIIRMPYSKNTKNNTYSSIVKTNAPIKVYTLDKLLNHSSYSNNSVSLDLFNVDFKDLYCVNQLIKNGVSKGSRNEHTMFIANACKYINMTEQQCLDKALEFNNNCTEPQRTSEIKRTIKSIYSNPTTIKPCKVACANRLCSNNCKYRTIVTNELLESDRVLEENVDIGFTRNLFLKRVKVDETKGGKTVKANMLTALKGTELMILAILKLHYNNYFTINELIVKTNLSEITVSKALKRLVELELIVITKQQIDKAKKPTNLYIFNQESVKRHKEIVTVNYSLFLLRKNKSITDNELKIYLALKYLLKEKDDTTYVSIECISGVDSKIINRYIKSLERKDLIYINKCKTKNSIFNTYVLNV